uniref:Uncharacterized protein n=1 Tax=Glossina austeni TaxID=7395 RepID=A0A1A9VBI8_GLOAU
MNQAIDYLYEPLIENVSRLRLKGLITEMHHNTATKNAVMCLVPVHMSLLHLLGTSLFYFNRNSDISVAHLSSEHVLTMIKEWIFRFFSYFLFEVTGRELPSANRIHNQNSKHNRNKCLSLKCNKPGISFWLLVHYLLHILLTTPPVVDKMMFPIGLLFLPSNIQQSLEYSATEQNRTEQHTIYSKIFIQIEIEIRTITITIRMFTQTQSKCPTERQQTTYSLNCCIK